MKVSTPVLGLHCKRFEKLPRAYDPVPMGLTLLRSAGEALKLKYPLSVRRQISTSVASDDPKD